MVVVAIFLFLDGGRIFDTIDSAKYKKRKKQDEIQKQELEQKKRENKQQMAQTIKSSNFYKHILYEVLKEERPTTVEIYQGVVKINSVDYTCKDFGFPSFDYFVREIFWECLYSDLNHLLRDKGLKVEKFNYKESFKIADIFVFAHHEIRISK